MYVNYMYVSNVIYIYVFSIFHPCFQINLWHNSMLSSEICKGFYQICTNVNIAMVKQITIQEHSNFTSYYPEYRM